MVGVGSNLVEGRIDGQISHFERDLAAFADWGVRTVEIPVHGLDAIQNGQLAAQRTQEVAALLEDKGLRISVHCPNSLDLMDPNDWALQQDVFAASLEFCRRIGAETLVVHPGRWVNEDAFLWQKSHPGEDACLERQEREITIVQTLAASYPDVDIAMENARPYKGASPYCYAEHPDLLVKQLERIDRPNVGATLDMGHLHMAAHYYEFDVLQQLDRLAPWVRHIHLHDNWGRSVYPTEKVQTHQIPLGKGDNHMPPGWGTVPWEAWLERLPVDYAGLIIVELRGRYFQETPSAVQLVQQFWARRRTNEALKPGTGTLSPVPV